MHQSLLKYHNSLWIIDKSETLESKLTQSMLRQSDVSPKGLTQFNQSLTKAVIVIEGILLPDCESWIEEYGYCSMARVSDEIYNLPPSVTELVLYINSQGGTVNGTVELADQIAKCKKRMSVTAYTDQICCSGGYFLASQASKIICAPTATIGSIGVMVKYAKISSADSAIKVIVLSVGKTKTYGSAYTQDSEEERAYFQKQIESTYEIFCTAVAEGRGVSVDRVKATEARADFALRMPSFMYDKIMSRQEFKETL